MKKRTGLAILAVAALYQANKMKKRKEHLIVATQGEVKQDKPKRKTPVEIIKEAEGKLKQVKNEVTKIIDKGKSNIIDVNAKDEPTKHAEPEIVNQEVATDVVDKNQPSEDTVYIVGKGKKYHLARNCRGIKKDAEISEMTLAEAIDKGYSLCGWEDK